MHCCEFCHTDYVPCPQVKKPRACRGCQKLRQRENEKAWKKKNLGIYDGDYHRAQREERKKEVRSRIERLVRVIEVGSTFLGERFAKDSREGFMHWLSGALLALGLRRANKLWCLELDQASTAL